MEKTGVLFISLVTDPDDLRAFRLLLRSIRSFAGELSTSPFRLFHPVGFPIPASAEFEEHVEIHVLEEAEPKVAFPFWRKVQACAQAEANCTDRVNSLVWLDPAVLVLHPPQSYLLDGGTRAAFRPVHIRNVGAPFGGTLDAYWQYLYETLSCHRPQTSVTSFVDGQELFPYFNTHTFSIDPGLGLMKQWRASFLSLIHDERFQTRLCQDDLHQLFLFQAVLSILVSKTLAPSQLRVLPETYNYPYHLQQQIPAERRARWMNDLTVLTYEEQNLQPSRLVGMDVREPLRQWLIDNLEN
jgi:hypothetical protein